MKFKLFVFSLLLSLAAQAQGIQISGQVLDATTAEPLPGVNVLVKGTTTGTSADFDGNFSLNGLSEGDVLVFTYIGFVPQEYVVGQSGNITIQLIICIPK